MAVVLTTAALAIAATGAGSAVAYSTTPGVFCSSAPASHECGSSAYPTGTEIKSTLSEKLQFKTTGGTTIMECWGSTFNMAVAEKLSNPAATAWTFQSCSTSFTMLRLAPGELKWIEGTNNGELWNGGELRISFMGLNCYFRPQGPFEVIGGSSPKIKVKGFAVGLSEGFCPSSAVMSGQYDISTPTPLYVEKP
ncbi:MAG TPA: hypothetical protein VK471_05415 [Solirubrobacterales bacterium]|nr:hypothetical protein [Solirubrobacterales bacterium]